MRSERKLGDMSLALRNIIIFFVVCFLPVKGETTTTIIEDPEAFAKRRTQLYTAFPLQELMLGERVYATFDKVLTSTEIQLNDVLADLAGLRFHSEFGQATYAYTAVSKLFCNELGQPLPAACIWQIVWHWFAKKQIPAHGIVEQMEQSYGDFLATRPSPPVLDRSSILDSYPILEYADADRGMQHVRTHLNENGITLEDESFIPLALHCLQKQFLTLTSRDVAFLLIETTNVLIDMKREDKKALAKLLAEKYFPAVDKPKQRKRKIGTTVHLTFKGRRIATTHMSFDMRPQKKQRRQSTKSDHPTTEPTVIAPKVEQTSAHTVADTPPFAGDLPPLFGWE